MAARCRSWVSSSGHAKPKFRRDVIFQLATNMRISVPWWEGRFIFAFLVMFLHIWTKKITVQVNLCQKLTWRTCCVQKLFWMSETISIHNMSSPGLSLEFSSIKLVIQWTICCQILVSWCKNKSFWQRFTCTLFQLC